MAYDKKAVWWWEMENIAWGGPERAEWTPDWDRIVAQAKFRRSLTGGN